MAYVLWEPSSRHRSYLRRHADDAASTATRLGTLIPLLRVTVAIMLTVVALLIALENIGVNVTPLLAGASVLGLALSFGSQTLVRDIVSGIFYLTDDAFRVGEFIDCEKAKGTVEGFTLRSVRLRNQSGQLHTVPFGELGRVTNFSRDWAASTSPCASPATPTSTSCARRPQRSATTSWKYPNSSRRCSSRSRWMASPTSATMRW